SPRGATAYDPVPARDTEPPGPVPGLGTAEVTADRLSLTWLPASDNVGVVGYRLWLNGFAVASTVDTRAEVRWFNDDTGQHVVQVKAVDAAGNQSPSSTSVVVTRPSPSPSPSDTPSTPPSPSPSPTPTPDPTPSATAPTADPSPKPNGDPTSSQGPRENT
ncbi:MAG: hypothetical protein JWP61_770, partial [Friedmanniella sp.]|nr:hypothetical protein [Friedmanniella sp.]